MALINSILILQFLLYLSELIVETLKEKSRHTRPSQERVMSWLKQLPQSDEVSVGDVETVSSDSGVVGDKEASSSKSTENETAITNSPKERQASFSTNRGISEGNIYDRPFELNENTVVPTPAPKPRVFKVDSDDKPRLGPKPPPRKENITGNLTDNDKGIDAKSNVNLKSSDKLNAKSTTAASKKRSRRKEQLSKNGKNPRLKPGQRKPIPVPREKKCEEKRQDTQDKDSKHSKCDYRTSKTFNAQFDDEFSDYDDIVEDYSDYDDILDGSSGNGSIS